MSQRMERPCLCNGIVLSLLLAFLFCSAYCTFSSKAHGTDVHIIDFVFKTDEVHWSSAVAYKHGFTASLWSRNFILAGRKVEIIPKKPKLKAVASCIETIVGNSSELFVVLGPPSAPHTLAALPALQNKNVVAFGPMTDLTTAHIWDKHLYFLVHSTKFSVHVLLRHVVVNMRVRRLGFMYTTDIHIGDSEYEHTKKAMKGINRELCGVFSIDGRVPYAAGDKRFTEKWEAFAETRPQAVIIISLRNSATKLFIHEMLRDPRTRSAYLLVSSFLGGMAHNMWATAKAKGVQTISGQVFTTRSFPSTLDTSSAMVRKYHSVINEYFEKGVTKGNGQGEANANKWREKGATLGGWITGEIIFQALSGFSASLERKDFIFSLFNQRSYIIEDFLLGTFGGEISKSLEKSGAVSSCNEGSNTGYIRKYGDEKIKVDVPEGNYAHSLHICKMENITLSDSAGMVTVNFSDVATVRMYAINEIKKGQDAAVSFDASDPKHDMTLKIIHSTYDDVTSSIQTEKENKWISIVTGVVHEATMDIPNLTFIDPIPTVARMNKFRRNVVFLSPTIEEQVYVLAQYVSSLPNCIVHAVIRSLSAQTAVEMVKKSLITFGVTLTSSVLLHSGDVIGNQLRASGFTIVIEVDKNDIPVFRAHLERNTQARLFILCNPFAMLYEHIFAVFNGTEAAERLLIITNLPHWADANSPSSMIHNYHKYIRDPLAWSPLSLQSFIVGRIIRRAVDSLKVVSSSFVTDYFYQTVTVRLDDMEFGPFVDKNRVACPPNSNLISLDCVKNFGATNISIWPMSRVFDPVLSPLFGPVTPSLEYRVPATGLSRAQLIAVIVGSLVGAAVLAAVLAVLVKWFCLGNFNAPKNPEQPVTLIFTDIQSSTALWAACPQIMTGAIETHHRMIRRLIAKHRCYEVKTVGDSFMIACKNPHAAVQLVGDLQRTFLEHDWGTSAIDEAYREFEERLAEADADYEPPTARLDAAVYRVHWRGLRVRAGVHTGLSDIRRDEVTKGYDYYGSASNTAARTESIAHGGQVLLTRAAFMALSAAERAGLDVTALGAVELRGVPEPVEMLQLNTVPGRTFPKLRLDMENNTLDSDDELESFTSMSSMSNDKGNSTVANVVGCLFSPLLPDHRVKVLASTCMWWGIPVSHLNASRSPDDLCRYCIQQLCLKINEDAKLKNVFSAKKCDEEERSEYF